MTDDGKIHIHGLWGAIWLLWASIFAGWTWVGFFYVPRHTWILGAVWIFAGWFAIEMLGAWRLKYKKPGDPEYVKTLSQLAQWVGQQANAGTPGYLGWGMAMIFIVGTISITAATVFWQISHPLGIFAGLTLPLWLYPHFWRRWVYG